MESGPQLPDACGGRPRCWHWGESDGNSAAHDIKAAIRHPVDGQPPTPNEVQARVAEFKHLVRTAQRGRLRDTEWDRVRRWPDLWELRWTWDDGTFVRGYFYEPLHWPAETVLALVHVKVILADPESTAARQNAEMDSAQRRVLRGEACTWGLPSSQPIVNLRHP